MESSSPLPEKVPESEVDLTQEQKEVKKLLMKRFLEKPELLDELAKRLGEEAVDWE